MPPSTEPLPLTPLVYRTLVFAQRHHQLLGVAPERLRLLTASLDTDLTPSFSSRGLDIVDRYDIVGLYLYVRYGLIVLVSEKTILCAAVTQQRIYIRTIPSLNELALDTPAVLIEEPLH